MVPKVKTEMGRGISLKDKNKFISSHNTFYSENMRINFIFYYTLLY